VRPIVSREEIPADWLEVPVVIPLVTPGHRWSLEREARELGFGSFATVIDPTVITAETGVIGEGTIVLGGAMLGARSTLGRQVCLNRGVTVGHHSTLDDYSSLGPACILCGFVSVGVGAFVGAGAVLNPQVSIGANAVVASGAVVRRDVPEHTLVAGNPAVVMRDGIVGYNEVSVDSVGGRAS
jgi:sugar O-acyltransferase (sialic acid O-acetyltransferase NeuD family)